MEVNTKNNKPLISVVMAVFNGENYLHKAIESILNQSYQNFEFIIVNDGSTDKTHNILQKFKNNSQKIIYLKNKTNNGQSKSWNRAIRIARGYYIARMDADDISLNNRFLKQIEYLQNNPEIGVLGCSSYVIHNESTKKTKPVNRNDDILNAKPPVHHPTCIIKKELFLKFGMYDSHFDNAEDYELWTRFYANGVKFHNIRNYLFLYRIHDNNVSINKIKKQIYLQLKISILGVFKYKIKYRTKGYLHILEQVLYLIYLSLNLDKIYKRTK